MFKWSTNPAATAWSRLSVRLASRKEVQRLVELGRLFIARYSGEFSLFPADDRDNAAVLAFVQTLGNASICTVGPVLIFGRLFDEIGFCVIPERLFRDIVLARRGGLVYPTSKLKTADYLFRYRALTRLSGPNEAQVVHRRSAGRDRRVEG